MKYNDYLKTEYWGKRKHLFKSKTYDRCFLCRNKNCLMDVHHKRYFRNGESILYNEKHTDLRLLCRVCHEKLHRYGYEKELAQNLIKRRLLRDILKTLS